ncbi:teichoic acid D-Ala incorporation-associated protein DltX [Melissococcus plutonius]
MKLLFQQLTANYWIQFFGRTIFYFFVILMLIYLYHYKNIDGGGFIYNEF